MSPTALAADATVTLDKKATWKTDQDDDEILYVSGTASCATGTAKVIVGAADSDRLRWHATSDEFTCNGKPHTWQARIEVPDGGQLNTGGKEKAIAALTVNDEVIVKSGEVTVEIPERQEDAN
ncbi:hypothetical protein [Nocardia altamirensis]|uniref:hypothetical protein n=1 Tax=Nocardia altamirensis TaxID=472158 RepID=UPI00083FE885|nr:hypothetical protein [Nocardia altamirensis]